MRDQLKRLGALPLKAVLLFIAVAAGTLGSLRDSITGEDSIAEAHKRRADGADRGQLGIFMVLIMGAIALVVVSIVLLFGMDIAGSFADGIDDTGTYADAADQTENSTGDAFSLFGTSVLVIPAAAVLAVLIGGLVGAISMRGRMPGMGGGLGGGRRR
jgi:ABC-type Fe3+ transport system permease subunit